MSKGLEPRAERLRRANRAYSPNAARDAACELIGRAALALGVAPDTDPRMMAEAIGYSVKRFDRLPRGGLTLVCGGTLYYAVAAAASVAGVSTLGITVAELVLERVARVAARVAAIQA